jgi:hypothetical protein
VRNGQIISGCFDPPNTALQIDSEGERSYVLSNWVLAMVTGYPRSEYDPIGPEEFGFLQIGEYVNKETRERVRFKVPRDLNLANAARMQPLAKFIR